MKIETLERAALLRGLFYGDSGSGKTSLIGSAMLCEDTFPLMVLNARGQPISLRRYDPRPFVISVEQMTDFNFPYNWIKAGQPRQPLASTHSYTQAELQLLNYFVEYLDSVGAEKFKSIAIDSITHVQRVSLAERTGAQQKLPGDAPVQTQIQHWGQTLSQLTRLADLYYTLPIHVFITALTRHDHIENLGMTMYHPFLWGQSALEVPSHAELVARLIPIESMAAQKVTALEKGFADEFSGGQPFNVLLTQGGRSFVAKWQGVEKPPSGGMVVAPTIGKLIDILKAD